MFPVFFQKGLLLCTACSLLSACCGNYRLFGALDGDYGLSDDLVWRQAEESRGERREIDEIIVRVAASHRNVAYGNVKIFYVSHDKKDTLVETVEDVSGSADLFEPKQVGRHLVRSGRIRAVQGPCLEPFPDEVFERSVLHVARKAAVEGGWSVVTITDWVQPVALKGVVQGKCAVEVRAFAFEGSGPGARLGTKMVNICEPGESPPKL